MTPIKNVKINGVYAFTVLAVKNNGNGKLFVHYPKILKTIDLGDGKIVTEMDVDNGIITNGSQTHDLEFIGNTKELLIKATLIEGKAAYHLREYLKIFKFKYNPDNQTWSKPTPPTPKVFSNASLPIEELSDNDLEELYS